MTQFPITEWLARVPLWNEAIDWIVRQDAIAYLVGGTVRDALLCRPSGDLDLAIDGEAMLLARRMADALGGAYVPMDAERDVARVVIRTSEGQAHLDLARLRAPTIEGDLMDRDFTINAIAVRVDGGMDELIDPSGGRDDLGTGVLRAVTSHAFQDDPTRVLRAVRQSGSLGFAVVPETEALARCSTPAIVRVSGERIRDEVTQILALPDAAASLRYADTLDVWETVLPEVQREARQEAYRRIGMWESCHGSWIQDDDCDVGDASESAGVASIAQHRQGLISHWREVISSERPRWVLCKLAGFLWRIEGRRMLERVLRRLKLSAREIQYVTHMVDAGSLLPLVVEEGVSSRVAIYRYYRRVGSAGLDGVLLARCDALSQGAEAPATEALADWARHGPALLDAWFKEHDTLVDPPQLITGRDLMDEAGISPGPRVGELLEQVRETQVDGKVCTREQALALVRDRVTG